jgi:hypothetical protein
MHKPSYLTIRTHLRQTIAFLAIAAIWHAQGLGQSSPTTEYIRAGGRLIAVLHAAPSDFTDLNGQSAEDVSEANLLYVDGVTEGCVSSPLQFCPTADLTRGQMAVFIIASVYVALQGPNQTAPAGGWVGGASPLPQYFTDVPPSNSFYDQIEQMMYIGITDGCSLSPPMYCPAANTTNAEMAVFTMAARSYILTGSAAAGHAGDFPYPTTPQCFPDVPSTDPYFPFVQALAQLNVIPCAGVSGPAFGEQNAITRIQAVPYAVRGILGEQSY